MSEQDPDKMQKRTTAVALVLMGSGMIALYSATSYSALPVCPPANPSPLPLTLEQRQKQPACRQARSGRSGSWSSGSSGSSSGSHSVSSASRGGFGGHGASAGG